MSRTLDLQKRGPKVVQEVDEQSLDVGSIVILIRHDHQMTVSTYHMYQ